MRELRELVSISEQEYFDLDELSRKRWEYECITQIGAIILQQPVVPVVPVIENVSRCQRLQKVFYDAIVPICALIGAVQVLVRGF